MDPVYVYKIQIDVQDTATWYLEYKVVGETELDAIRKLLTYIEVGRSMVGMIPKIESITVVSSESYKDHSVLSEDKRYP